MPIYEYKCTDCDHEYEIIQKINDEPILECENCHKPSAKRLVSAPGFQLKGTGWYETDFKTKSKPKEKSSNTDIPAIKTESKSSDSKSTDTKPTENKVSASKKSEDK